MNSEKLKHRIVLLTNVGGVLNAFMAIWNLNDAHWAWVPVNVTGFALCLYAAWGQRNW